MLIDLFDQFDKINNQLDNNVVELSIKKSRISLSFENGDVLKIDDIKKINKICDKFNVGEINTFHDVLYVHFTELQEENITDDDKCPISKLYNLIFKLRDILCTCPALEYIISGDYLKVFIDLPNIKIVDISKLDRLFKSEGFLELNMQRPYVLYIRDVKDNQSKLV